MLLSFENRLEILRQGNIDFLLKKKPIASLQGKVFRKYLKLGKEKEEGMKMKMFFLNSYMMKKNNLIEINVLPSK